MSTVLLQLNVYEYIIGKRRLKVGDNLTERKSYTIGKEAFDSLSIETEADIENRLHDRVYIIIHLKQRMAERGLTQMQLAEMAGVRQATISQMSRGNIEKLHIPTLEKIAWAMGIDDLSQLLTFEMESEIMNLANPFDVDFGSRK